MSRRGHAPAHQRHTGRRPQGRPAVWAAVRAQRAGITVRSIEAVVEMTDSGIRTYLKALERGGYITRTNGQGQQHDGNSRFAAATYDLTNDTGVHHPRLNADGTPTTKGQANDQLWRSMKMLTRFTPAELATAASTDDCIVKQSGAAKYVQALARAGYLAKRKGQYSLIPSRNTGPLPPVVQHTPAVYDENEGRLVWTAVGGAQ